MEARLVIGYALIGVIVVGSAIAGVVLQRRRAARRRRLRGIKTDEIARANKRRAA